MTPDVRPCSRCGELLPVDEFARDASKSSGRKGYCKACDAARCRDYYARSGEQKKARLQTVRDAAGPRRCRRCGDPTPSRRRQFCDACRPPQKSRPGTTQRGYGHSHQKLRAELAPEVSTGRVECSRCGSFIAPGSPWVLARNPEDRSQYAGPAHRSCHSRRR